jgi:hypothetical protein
MRRILYTILVGVLCLFCGIVIGIQFFDKDQVIYSNIIEQEVPDTFEEGWNKAREIVEESGVIRSNALPLTSIRGVVTTLSDNQMQMEADIQVQNPLAEKPPIIRTVILNDSVVFEKRVEKTQEQYQEELEAYRELRKKYLEDLGGTSDESGEAPIMPNRYIITEVDRSNLKEGVSTVIIGDASDDLQYKVTIIPQRIQILE